MPLASADPADPTPDPTASPSPSPEPTGPTPDPTPDPTASPSPSPEPTEPTPEPEPTEPPEPTPSPDDGSPSPSPDDDGKDEGNKKKDRDKANQQDRKDKKKDPFALAGLQNTAKLVSILAPVTKRGMSLKKALLKVVGPFPVAGLAWWTDDWHAARCCPFRHLHQGLDIFAPVGTPLVAAADGYISQEVNSPVASGLGLEITDARGIQYFYAHLSAFAPNIEVGTRVEMGQVIGFVGDTGNARGSIPHVHFEYQPHGVPHPPKPWVDRWLKLAEHKARKLVQEVTGRKPRVERLTFRLTRLFDLMYTERADLAEATGENTGELLVLTALHPAVTYDMARDTAGSMAWEIDWGEEAADQVASGFQDYQEQITEQTLMGILEAPSQLSDGLIQPGTVFGGEGLTLSEGIGDPTAPVVTEPGGARWWRPSRAPR